MTEFKTFFKSKTIWGGVLALLAGLGELLGYKVSPEEQQYLSEAIPGIVSTVGGVLAIYGRVNATKKIGK